MGDLYGSKVKLVENDEEANYLKKAAPSKSKAGERSPPSSSHCFLSCVGFIAYLSLVVLLCIGAFYVDNISKVVNQQSRLLEALAKRVDQQKQQIQTLEDNMELALAELKTKDQTCSTACKEVMTNTIEGSASLARSRRNADESDHIISEHHGIASHNIAYVYGDIDKLISKGLDESSPTELFFTPSNKQNTGCVGTLMRNGLHDYWCRMQHKGQTDEFKMTKNGKFFHYFSEAPWMSNPAAKENFNVTYDGKIVVGKRGIYMIHATIHFLHEAPSPSFGIFKSDEYGNNPTLITKCLRNQLDQDHRSEGDIYSCEALTIVALKPKDMVYLNIAGYNWFRVEQQSFQFVVMKLNDYSPYDKRT